LHPVPDRAFEVSKNWAVIDERFGDAAGEESAPRCNCVGVESRPKPKWPSAVRPRDLLSVSPGFHGKRAFW
jgi:hypothetical protein